MAQRAGDSGWVGLPWTAPVPDQVRPREALTDGALDGASYLIVAPRLFHDALAPLVTAREAESLTVKLVTPEAVYDTFGSGVPEAGAIQAMVRQLSAEGALRYLLLVGDASPDPESVWSADAPGLPTAWVQTAYVGHTASDFALVAGSSGEAEVAVGRFPVSTAAEVETLVAKTLAWQPNSRLAYVNDDAPEFVSLVTSLEKVQEADLVVSASVEDARREVLAWLRGGPGTLVYAGHGSLQLLGDEKLLTVDDGESWSELTIAASWSCLCASFAHPTYRSLAEALLLGPQGVVAFVGPTGETTSSEQASMALEFQRAIAEGQTIGDALLKAWHAATSENVQKGFLLLGDPALRPMPPVLMEDDGNG